MNHAELQHILVIDDTASVAERIQRLLPQAQVAAAYNGVYGLDYVRTHHNLDLVILDVRMPHNGVRVALQIREIDRTVRILPFSDDQKKDQLLQEMGCAPLLSKSVSDQRLIEAIHQAAAMPISPLPRSVFLEHYHDESTEAERDVRQSLSITVALLLSARSLMPMIEQSLDGANAVVVGKATSARLLEPYITALKPKILLADTVLHQAAQSLAESHNLPLLVVGMSLADTYSSFVYKPAGIIYDVTDINKLAEALSALLRGETYRDPLLTRILIERDLKQAYQDLVPYLLRGMSPEDIAKHVKLTPETIRNYKMAIYRSFQASDIGDFRDRINELLFED